MRLKMIDVLYTPIELDCVVCCLREHTHLTDGMARSVDVGSVVCHTVFNNEDSICQNFVLLSVYLGADTFGCKSFQGCLYANIF
jgi:hypothetical protein